MESGKNILNDLDQLSDSLLLKRIREIREEYKICQEVTFAEGDNVLYVDLDNVLSIRVLLSRAKNILN